MAWGDDIFPGNYGLWDLKAALRFVSTNVKAFGGDPKRITLWGHSAGAAAVSAMTLSTATRGKYLLLKYHVIETRVKREHPSGQF